MAGVRRVSELATNRDTTYALYATHVVSRPVVQIKRSVGGSLKTIVIAQYNKATADTPTTALCPFSTGVANRGLSSAMKVVRMTIKDSGSEIELSCRIAS